MPPRLLLSIALAAGLTACGRPSQVAIDDSWVRLAAVPGRPAAAYFTLTGGATDMTLVGVASPAARRAQMHDAATGGGMAPVARFALPAHGALTFAPGGRHAMLFDMDPGVKPGGTVPLTVTFADGRTLSVAAKAVAAGDAAPRPLNAVRALTPGEVALGRSMFGDAIDYGQARIANRKWWWFQPRHYAMAPRGCIHFHPKGALYRADFSACDDGMRGFFLHELTHIWQHQRGVFLPLARHPFCRYGYSFVPGRPFNRYGIEQQAEMVRHAFLLRQGHRIAGAPSLGQYDSVLPFA